MHFVKGFHTPQEPCTGHLISRLQGSNELSENARAPPVSIRQLSPPFDGSGLLHVRTPNVTPVLPQDLVEKTGG